MAVFGDIVSDKNVLVLDLQTPSVSATMNIVIAAGNKTYLKFTADQNITINISSGTPSYGDELVMIITNDGAEARTITFGTKLKSSGNIVGTINKVAVVTFVSDGTDYYESSRTLGL